VQAFLEAERQQRENAKRQQQNPAQPSGVQQPAEIAQTSGKVDRVSVFLAAEQGDRAAKKAALAKLTRLFGREVNEQEGQEATSTRGRDRGGGISR
jgi:hypothetical protein